MSQLHRKQAVKIPIPFANKQQKIVGGAPINALPVGKNPKLICQSLATNVKEFSQQTNRLLEVDVWQASMM